MLPTWLGYARKVRPADRPAIPQYRRHIRRQNEGGKEDCSQPFGPCLRIQATVRQAGAEGADREKEAKSHTMSQHMSPTGAILGRNTWWNRLPTETRWGAGTNYFLHPQSKMDSSKSQTDLMKEHASGLDTPGEQPGKPESEAAIPAPGSGTEAGVFGWKKDSLAKAGGEGAAASQRLRR